MPDLDIIAVYCGGLDVLSEIMKNEMDKIDEVIEADTWEEVTSKVNEEVRTQIIGVLNQHAEVINIKSLFEKMPAIMELGRFNPIVFDFRLPLSLQSSRSIKFISESHTFDAENFKIVYDGRLLMVAAPCSLEERPSGIIDIRDLFIGILEGIGLSPQMIAPCMTHRAFILATSKKNDRETNDVYVTVKKGTSIIDMMMQLYLTIYYPMGRFYYSCTISEKIEELERKLAETQEDLFNSLKDLEIYGWRDLLKKRQTLKRIRTCILQMLEKLAEYPSEMQLLKNELESVRTQMNEGKLFKEFMEKSNWLDYADTEPLDIQSFTRTIEYAHGEIETHSITTSETRAALIGGLVASIATLVLSHLISMFPPSSTPATNSTMAQTILFLLSLLPRL